VYENGDKNSLNFNAVMMMIMKMVEKQNFKIGHPIVFLINDSVNISRHNYVYMYFIAATCFDLTSRHQV
jgi:hypothetical protein